MKNSKALSQTNFLDLASLTEVCGVSRSTLVSLIQVDPDFPASTLIAGKRHWPARQVLDYWR